MASLRASLNVRLGRKFRYQALILGTAALAALVAVDPAPMQSQIVNLGATPSVPVSAATTGFVPAGFVETPAEEQTVTTDSGNTLYFDSQGFVKTDADGQAVAGIFVEVATDPAASWAAEAAAANAGNDAKPDGTIAGHAAALSQRPDLSQITWLADRYTQVTVGIRGNAVDYPIGLLEQVAHSVTIVPTKRLASAPSEPSTGSITLSALEWGPYLAFCDTTCPQSTDMNGAGDLTNDWQGNVTICDGCSVQKGNVVGVWQAVMWADQMCFISGNTYCQRQCDVDGGFGTYTQNMTESWQLEANENWGYPGLAYDGIVGPATWGVADNYLAWSGSLVAYRGFGRSVYFQRQSSSPGHYTWTWGGTPYYYTGYYGVQINKASC